MAMRAQDHVRHELSFERSTVELVEWANRPCWAPDHTTKGGSWFSDPTAGMLMTYIKSPFVRRVLSLPVIKETLKAIAGRR